MISIALNVFSVSFVCFVSGLLFSEKCFCTHTHKNLQCCRASFRDGCHRSLSVMISYNIIFSLPDVFFIVVGIVVYFVVFSISNFRNAAKSTSTQTIHPISIYNNNITYTPYKRNFMLDHELLLQLLNQHPMAALEFVYLHACHLDLLL